MVFNEYMLVWQLSVLLLSCLGDMQVSDFMWQICVVFDVMLSVLLKLLIFMLVMLLLLIMVKRLVGFMLWWIKFWWYIQLSVIVYLKLILMISFSGRSWLVWQYGCKVLFGMCFIIRYDLCGLIIVLQICIMFGCLRWFISVVLVVKKCLKQCLLVGLLVVLVCMCLIVMLCWWKLLCVRKILLVVFLFRWCSIGYLLIWVGKGRLLKELGGGVCEEDM